MQETENLYETRWVIYHTVLAVELLVIIVELGAIWAQN